MQITISDDTGSNARVGLVGKLDIAGAEVVALPLATLSGAKKGLIIDMSGVTFIASIGIRHILLATKTMSRRGGRLVLLNPTEMVKDVLETSGVADLIPMVTSESEALAMLD
jgi:anti-anti-sigma factor